MRVRISGAVSKRQRARARSQKTMPFVLSPALENLFQNSLSISGKFFDTDKPADFFDKFYEMYKNGYLAQDPTSHPDFNEDQNAQFHAVFKYGFEQASHPHSAEPIALAVKAYNDYKMKETLLGGEIAIPDKFSLVKKIYEIGGFLTDPDQFFNEGPFKDVEGNIITKTIAFCRFASFYYNDVYEELKPFVVETTTAAKSTAIKPSQAVAPADKVQEALALTNPGGPLFKKLKTAADLVARSEENLQSAEKLFATCKEAACTSLLVSSVHDISQRLEKIADHINGTTFLNAKNLGPNLSAGTLQNYTNKLLAAGGIVKVPPPKPPRSSKPPGATKAKSDSGAGTSTDNEGVNGPTVEEVD